ncbi:MAG: NAD(+) diphosphatase [Actinomycetota bacterium]
MLFLPAVVPPSPLFDNAWWFLFHGDLLLVQVRGADVAIPRWASTEEAGLLPVRTQFLGSLDGVPCYSGELAGEVGPEGTSFQALRPLLRVLPEEIFSLAGRAYQVMDWDRTHQYCGKCGGRTDPLEGERGRSCPACGLHFFPRVTPAIIVAVVRDGKILLAQSTRFPAAFYSVLAGFVEPGETFEECVRREIREEVGIEVESLRYFGSQPWPFPHSLMVGFTASFAGGDLVLEEKEIVRAGWFGPEEVRRLRIPHHGTIARRMIDRFLADARPGEGL